MWGRNSCDHAHGTSPAGTLAAQPWADDITVSPGNETRRLTGNEREVWLTDVLRAGRPAELVLAAAAMAETEPVRPRCRRAWRGGGAGHELAVGDGSPAFDGPPVETRISYVVTLPLP